MKKIVFVICLFMLLSVLTGCQIKGMQAGPSAQTGTTTASQNTTAAESTYQQTVPTPVLSNFKVADYFPLLKDIHYIYKGTGNEYAAYDVYNDYVSENKVQQRINNGGTETARVFEISNGKLTMLFSRAEVYYRENFLNTVEGDPEVYLMEPLVIGNSWNLKGSRRRTITNITAEVITPMGKYEAIEVTTDTPEGKNLDYYARDVGLVKSVFKSGDLEVTSLLEKIDKNVKKVVVIDFYYPVNGSNKLHYVSKNISFNTNDITKKVIEATYKDMAKQKLGKPVSEAIRTISLYLNKDNMVYIDLNSAFITEINKQKQYERLILQSIANTFGNYYNSQKVILTINNSLYKSESISMKKGEYLKVNTEGSIKDEQ